MLTNETERAVYRLAAEHPAWLPVLEAAVVVAEQQEGCGGEFAGAWVLEQLRHSGGARWVPNLRLLVSHGLLEKSGPSSRGGRRAYYRMPDREGVVEAIAKWRANGGGRAPRRLSFVAAGASAEPPTDIGRRSGEIRYEPSPWR